MFHRHSLSSFTMNASEIAGITFLGAIDVQTKENRYFDVTKIKCPDHGLYLRPHGDCPRCNFQGVAISKPDPRDVIIEFTTCQTCNYFKVTAQCSKYKYLVNEEWIKHRIVQIKKDRDEAELERLLNMGNPDYKKDEKVVKPECNHADSIKEYADAISRLQTNLRLVVGKLNESLKNDGIWEALPTRVRNDLIAKYHSKATIYQPIDVNELLKVPFKEKT